MERVSRRPFGPAAQSQPPASRIPATAPRAGLKSPAWATGQGCSPAVAPAAPGLRAGRGLRKETEKDRPNPRGPQPLEWRISE